MVRKGVIDIGSNTIKLYIADIFEPSIIKPLIIKRRMARLGSNIDKTKILSEESKEIAIKHIKNFINICREYEIKNENILTTATAACRNAKNGNEFIDRIKNDFNLTNIKILTGEEEAKYTFLGVIDNIKEISNDLFCVIDIGGGSFQVSIGTKTNYIGGTSIQKGGNNVTEEFTLNKPASVDRINSVIDYIKNYSIKNITFPKKELKLVGAGGTIKIMQLMLRDNNDLTPLTLEEIKNTAYMLAPLGKKERFEWFKNKYPNKNFRIDCGLTKNRSEVFLAGLCITAGLMLKLSVDNINFSITDAKDYIIKLDKLI